MIARKFLFDTDFETPDSAGGKKPAESLPPEPEFLEEEEAPPPAPVFTEEDLALARQEAFQQGLLQGQQEGLTQAAASQQNAQNEALTRIAELMRELQQNAKHQKLKAEEVAVATALAVIGKMLPTYSRKHGFGEVESLIRTCLQNLQEEPRIVIRVADSLLDSLQEKITAITANIGFDGKVVLLADDELAPSDIRIEWADGGAERDSRRLWQEINAIMSHVHSAADLPPETTPPPAEPAVGQVSETPRAATGLDSNPEKPPEAVETSSAAVDAFEHLPEFSSRPGNAQPAPETPPSPQPASFEEALSTASDPARTAPAGLPQKES